MCLSVCVCVYVLLFNVRKKEKNWCQCVCVNGNMTPSLPLVLIMATSWGEEHKTWSALVTKLFIFGLWWGRGKGEYKITNYSPRFSWFFLMWTFFFLSCPWWAPRLLICRAFSKKKIERFLQEKIELFSRKIPVVTFFQGKVRFWFSPSKKKK